MRNGAAEVGVRPRRALPPWRSETPSPSRASGACRGICTWLCGFTRRRGPQHVSTENRSLCPSQRCLDALMKSSQCGGSECPRRRDPRLQRGASRASRVYRRRMLATTRPRSPEHSATSTDALGPGGRSLGMTMIRSLIGFGLLGMLPSTRVLVTGAEACIARASTATTSSEYPVLEPRLSARPN